VNGEVLNDFGFGVRRVSSLGLHLGEACLPVASSMSFTEDFLDVDFTDASTSQTNPIDSWTWDFGDGNTSTDQNPSHTYATPGQYEVCLTITNLCSSNTFCDSVEVFANTTGLSDAWMENVIVYPVPASEVLKVKNIPAGLVTVELRNIVGQLIYTETFGLDSEIEVPVFNLASGQYNLMIQSESGVLNKSVLVR
jgi:PKD repeat protein